MWGDDRAVLSVWQREQAAGLHRSSMAVLSGYNPSTVLIAFIENLSYVYTMHNE